MTELADLGVAELLDLFRKGDASPTEAVTACLARIDRIEPRIHAILTLLPERALNQAAESDARWRRGDARPLEGVPYGLKDIIETAGIRTTGGSLLYLDHVPTENASVAQRLEDAGGILLAKLQTFEFASGANADTNNAWDLARTAAGSSSGSAAALAARQMPLTVGTDTGGSIAIPASFTATTGLKATFGRVPRHGVFPLSWTLDHVGPMTRSALDNALALNVVAGRDPRDPSSATAPVPDYTDGIESGVTGMRIGVPTDHFFDIIDPVIADATHAMVDTLVGLGARRVDVALPALAGLDLHAMELTLIYAEIASVHEVEWEDRAKYGPEFSKLIARAQFVSAMDYLKALRARNLVQRDFEAAFERCDVFIAPGAITIAPRHDHLVAALGGEEAPPWVEVVSRTTAIFDMVGIPTLSIPSGFTQDMPIGVQVAARPYDEATMYRASHAYQQVTDHHMKLPPIVAEDSAAQHEPWSLERLTTPRTRPPATMTLDETW